MLASSRVWAVSLSLVLVTSVFSFATPVQQVYAQGEIISPDTGLVPITAVFPFLTSVQQVYAQEGIIAPNTGGGSDGDRSAPTFGLDHNTFLPVIEGGFSFNGVPYDITDNFWTPFEEQEVKV